MSRHRFKLEAAVKQRSHSITRNFMNHFVSQPLVSSTGGCFVWKRIALVSGNGAEESKRSR
jgi:hypothetical protein